MRMTINIKITIQGAISHFFHFTFLMNPSLTHIANSVSFYNDKDCKMMMTINTNVDYTQETPSPSTTPAATTWRRSPRRPSTHER